MSIDSVMPSNHLILCHPRLLPTSVFSSIRVFSNESVLHIRWPKYWSFRFKINPSNEYSGLISFRIDWFDLLVVKGTRKSSPASQFKNINSSVLSFLYGPTLTYIHDYRKNHSFDYTDLGGQWRKAWQPSPILLPGESAWTEEPGGLQSVHRIAKSPWGCKKSNMTEHVCPHTQF